MLHAWVIWFLSALFMFYKNAIEVSPSVMSHALMKEFFLTGAEMGNFAAAYFYAYLLLQIPAALLIDRWGPRRVTTVAMILCALGSLIFSVSDSILIACIGRFISGVGAAFAAINCLKLVANWFPAKKFAFMAGLMMTVGMLGAVWGQAPLASLISWLGWREAMQVLSVAGVVLALLFVAIVRDRAPHHVQKDFFPEKVDVFTNLKNLLKNPQSWYLSFFSGFAFAPVSAFGGLWGIPFLSASYSLSLAAAAKGSSLIFLGFAAGAPLFGWYSDRIGKRRPVMFWGTLIAALCLTAVLYVPHLPVSLVFCCLFVFGFSISAFLLCFTMIKENNLAALAATSIGFMNAFDALFGAFSDPLTGKILDLLWTGATDNGARIFSQTAYHYGLLILVVYFVLALIFMKFIRETHCKQVLPTSMP
jgi:MFS family permease